MPKAVAKNTDSPSKEKLKLFSYITAIASAVALLTSLGSFAYSYGGKSAEIDGLKEDVKIAYEERSSTAKKVSTLVSDIATIKEKTENTEKKVDDIAKTVQRILELILGKDR